MQANFNFQTNQQSWHQQQQYEDQRLPLTDVTEQALYNQNMNQNQSFPSFQDNAQQMKAQESIHQQQMYGNWHAQAQVTFNSGKPAFCNPFSSGFQANLSFNQTQPQTQYFQFNNSNSNNQEDGDDDDDEYIEGEDEYSTHNQIDEDLNVMNDIDDNIEEEKKNDDMSSTDDERDLVECCEPETNALQELAAEADSNFDLEAYLKFRAQLEQEEQMNLNQQQQFQQQPQWQDQSQFYTNGSDNQYGADNMEC
ncbi:UNKNOWN [Stylonychia lemnae]|uniref:Uncharacterized protein n=1 Tax=Stylonychia lemnae TaxID=5949 RepID=A0A078ANC4_STYLE|nr:UNKNOWN [Stylonychia lemnae]|eukprot:CDW83865.1 UNKNOWN [Stylonychia lemnae]